LDEYDAPGRNNDQAKAGQLRLTGYAKFVVDFIKRYIMKVTTMLKEIRWEDIDWAQVERSVFRKQNQMYRAALASNIPEVRKLQRDLLKDPYAKLLSVRRVTTENTGRNTSGVDREIIRSNEERLQLASKLNLSKDYHANP